MGITVTHDNGNHVCLSDGSVYVRQDAMLHAPEGSGIAPMPLPREQAERLIGLMRARAAHPSAR